MNQGNVRLFTVSGQPLAKDGRIQSRIRSREIEGLTTSDILQSSPLTMSGIRLKMANSEKYTGKPIDRPQSASKRSKRTMTVYYMRKPTVPVDSEEWFNEETRSLEGSSGVSNSVVGYIPQNRFIREKSSDRLPGLRIQYSHYKAGMTLSRGASYNYDNDMESAAPVCSVKKPITVSNHPPILQTKRYEMSKTKEDLIARYLQHCQGHRRMEEKLVWVLI